MPRPKASRYCGYRCLLVLPARLDPECQVGKRPEDRGPRSKTIMRKRKFFTFIMLFKHSQEISNPANIVDEFCSAMRIYLLAQTINIDLNQISFAFEMIIPDMFDNLATGYELRR